MKIHRALTSATCTCGLLLVMAAPSQAALIRGTDGPDNLVGTRFADKVLGRQGHDVIKALRGPDEAWGERGDDRIALGPGDDYGDGGRGDDVVTGGPGADTVTGGGVNSLFGGPGNDKLWSGTVRSVMNGGGGRDRFSMLPGDHRVKAGPGDDVVRVYREDVETAETINCGEGFDVVRYVDEIDLPAPPDPADTLRDCERVRPAPAPSP